MKYVIFVVLGLVLGAGAQAQVYKWVDAQGQVHYSGKPEASGKAKVSELKVAAPPSTAPPDAAPQGLSMVRPGAPRPRVSNFQAPRSQGGAGADGEQPETDQSRCALARRVLNGTARHTNGARTDANDREVAERDVKSFCH
ncbi:MAG: DUF4124 domain-containing protein [Pseudomonadota bacterium]